MPGLQPGHASVYFEVYFDKLSPSTVRSAIATDCVAQLDALVPVATRDTWLNCEYTGDGSAVDMLDFVSKLFELVNPNLVPKPTPKQDFYCWMGAERTCYATFSLQDNGTPVTLTIESDGYQVECEIMVIMKTLAA
ncbi:MAG: hypothetical protein ACX94C_02140 [Phycisphaerales bacterium]